MRGHVTHIRLATDIKAPVDVCFDFCLNVDVQLSLDPGMRAVGGVKVGPLTLGDAVTWRAWHFGIPWHMTSEIITVDRPHCFGDQMQQGPFAHWRHVHTFEEIGIGTRMHDAVDYDAPLGPIGRLFECPASRRLRHPQPAATSAAHPARRQHSPTRQDRTPGCVNLAWPRT
jgi:ligand-binding SRPBCC domain-containing protein